MTSGETDRSGSKRELFWTSLETFEPRSALWRQWQRVEPALAGHDFCAVRRELLDRHVTPERKDKLLGALIRKSKAPGGHEARVATIACLLPGARRLASRFSRTLGWHDALSETVAALWVALERFDIEAERPHIASRLLAAVRPQLAKQAGREWAWLERTSVRLDLETVPVAAPVAADALVADTVDGATLSKLDVALVEATRLSGLSLRDAATLLGLNYEAAKKRRQRAEADCRRRWMSEGHQPPRTAVATRAA